ncbi:hypothetical protein Scep_014181 [Stephania cephalantha]|uniref:Uncharacterized protein n=1 Tax=Stephania cephalantha TaxID=152367 RepID=A0AAP0P1E8_9MAGN
MAATAEPVVSRLDRLDNMLRHLEGMRGGSPRSSYTSSGTLTSTEGGNNSSYSIDDSSPTKTMEKQCRPIDAVVMESETKGSLVVRLAILEDRLLKLCVQMEEERREELNKDKEGRKKKKGLKQLVKSCVGGGGVTPKNNEDYRNIQK